MKDFSEYQVQVLLERILRRPLWKVKREGMIYFVFTTSAEPPIPISWRDMTESMSSGNCRPTPTLQKTLLDFQNRGVPDKDGNDTTGRFAAPDSGPKPKSISSIFRSLFGSNGKIRE